MMTRQQIERAIKKEIARRFKGAKVTKILRFKFVFVTLFTMTVRSEFLQRDVRYGYVAVFKFVEDKLTATDISIAYTN